jgi:secreted PhoX family phosphatase
VSTAPLNRRGFLGRTALTGLGVALAGSVDALGRPAFASAAQGQAIGYGPLVPDPNRILSLPVGFSYTVVSRSGETQMDGGVPVPSDPDAIGVFARPGGSTLVTNHEIGSDEPFGVPALEGLTYDAGARRHDHDRGRRRRGTAGPVRQRRGHREQLRGRHHPVGGVADL